MKNLNEVELASLNNLIKSVTNWNKEEIDAYIKHSLLIGFDYKQIRDIVLAGYLPMEQCETVEQILQGRSDILMNRESDEFKRIKKKLTNKTNDSNKE